MTKEERALRFEVALEMVEKISLDYYKDDDITREEKEEMSNFVVDMIKMHDKIKSPL